MPRGPRLDAPGVFHHLMVRGVERRPIFGDDRDRLELLTRLDAVLVECRVRCFAWVLMPNHFHLLVRTGEIPLHHAMRRIGTSYAMYFNRRWDRVGHLFQDRFKTRPVGSQGDLRGLVRYLHRNPVKAGLASGRDLDRYPWCGHGALVGAMAPRLFHEVRETLEWFGARPNEARQELRAWMCAEPEAAPAFREEATWREEAERISELLAERDRVCRELGVDPESLRKGCRDRDASRARGMLAHIARSRLGLPCRAFAPLLGISFSGASRAAAREARCTRAGADRG